MAERAANVFYWGCCLLTGLIAVPRAWELLFAAPYDRWELGREISASSLIWLLGRAMPYIVTGK